MAYSKMRRDGSARNSVDENQRGARSDQRKDFQETGEIVDDEAAAEGHELAGRQHQLQHAGQHQQTDRKAGNRPVARSPR